MTYRKAKSKIRSNFGRGVNYKTPGSSFHIIAVDFDGVLAGKSRRGKLGKPIEGMITAIPKLAKRFELVVFSSRAIHPNGHQDIIAWLEKHNLKEYFSRITSTKINALAYLDDRAVRFSDWPATLDYFNA